VADARRCDEPEDVTTVDAVLGSVPGEILACASFPGMTPEDSLASAAPEMLRWWDERRTDHLTA
jgi:hypothetical protein